MYDAIEIDKSQYRVSGGDENYHKNCKTNELTEFIKVKPAGSILKGSALIELFDAETGEKVEETRSENLILNGFNKFLYNLIIECLCQKLTSNIGTSIQVYINMFGNIVLTDYNGAEDATNDRIRGAIVGWANKGTGYAGADTLKGTVNLASSNVNNPATLNFVFDWPTTAGNGTFQTLWWIPARMDTVTAYPMRHWFSPVVASTGIVHTGNTAVGFYQAYCKFCIVNNALYFINQYNLHGRIIKSSRAIDQGSIYYPAGVEVKDLGLLTAQAPVGIQYDVSLAATKPFCIYMISGTNANKFMYYDSAYAYVSTSVAFAAATYFPGGYCSYVCHRGLIYTWSYTVNNWNLNILDPATGVLATINIMNDKYIVAAVARDPAVAWSVGNSDVGTDTALCIKGATLYLIRSTGTKWLEIRLPLLVTLTLATSTVNQTAHGLRNNDVINFCSVTTITTPNITAYYYVTYVDANSYTLSTTRDDANPVVFAGAGDGSGVLGAVSYMGWGESNSITLSTYTFDDYGNIFVTNNNSNGAISVCEPRLSPLTQNLLTVPTTKTSANTMKLTYSFSLDLTGI